MSSRQNINNGLDRNIAGHSDPGDCGAWWMRLMPEAIIARASIVNLRTDLLLVHHPDTTTTTPHRRT